MSDRDKNLSCYIEPTGPERRKPPLNPLGRWWQQSGNVTFELKIEFGTIEIELSDIIWTVKYAVWNEIELYIVNYNQSLWKFDTMSSRQSVTINPPSVPEPQPQFSQVNTFNLTGPTKIVAITGQLAIQPDGKSPTPKAFDDQVRLALQNLGNCLEAAGASKRDIFKVTHYVVDFDFEKKNPAKVFIDWLGIDHRPASVMMPVARLAGPDWHYEIECWAIVPQ